MSSHSSSSPSPLPVVVLTGIPFERGRQHGHVFGERIAFAIARLKESHTPAAYQRARTHAARSWAKLEIAAPAIAAEIQGIAQGALCDPLDIYCHIGFEFFDADAATGCSGIALSTPNGAIIGQNWDAPPEMREDLALFLHVGTDGLRHAIIGSIGTLGWVGCNSAGLALLTNDLMLDSAADGLPSQVIRRLILSERDIASALDRLDPQTVMGGRCYLLGDRTGSIAGLELSPRAGVHRVSAATCIAHTNHALIEATRAVEDEVRLRAVYPSSRNRLAALERSLGGIATTEDIMAALRDTTNAPDAVSKTISDEEGTRTAFSVIFDCRRGLLHLCDGPPAEGHYQTFHWPEIALPGISAHRIPAQQTEPATPF